MRIRGSCHCRNVSFTLDWTPEPAEIPARACSCTFCTKHGAVWTACPTASLVVAIGDPALTSAYRFGTG
ncbi:MAG TPA: aldehyde-activating protein, partial [Rhodanobacteraceae bacterium]|nr:aldehyde-activating protein [Rhodanobacteraceae bacterium]